MMNLGDDEKEKIISLDEKLKDPKLSVDDKKVLVLQDIANSLSIIAGKVGRKLL